MPAAGNRIDLQKLSRTQNILYLKIGLLTLAMAKEPIRRIEISSVSNQRPYHNQ
jgi:hypothetical protein